MNDIKPVVVGVDGSPSSLAALDFAAAMATRRGVPLHLAYARSGLSDAVGLTIPGELSDTALPDEMAEILRADVLRIRARHPELTVAASQVARNPSVVLIEQSRRALAVVVGCRGVGGFTGLLLGSVSTQVSAHADGPVIVVRPPLAEDAVLPDPEQAARRPKPLGPVMACTDGSPEAALALRFAAEEATSRHVQLIVVHVDDGPIEDAEKLLITAIEPLAAVYRGPAIELRPIESKNVPEALIEATRRAALTVVGSRGRGGFAGAILGSVSRALTHHAYGPVAVIHPAPQEKE